MENKKVAGGHRIGEGGTRSIVRREGGFQLLNKRCAFLESRFVFLLCENIGVQLVPCSHVVVKIFLAAVPVVVVVDFVVVVGVGVAV